LGQLRFVRCSCVDTRRDAEVEKLHEVRITCPLGKKNIVGLQIPVDDAKLVSLVQGPAYLLHHVQHSVDGQGS
jgi:hypothetical protein